MALGRKKASKANKGGTATIDNKNANIAAAMDTMIGKFRTLRNDARQDLCGKGRTAFDAVIESMVHMKNVVLGDAEPLVPPVAEASVTQLEQGRDRVAEWVDELGTEIQDLLLSTPQGLLADALRAKTVALSARVRGLRLTDLQ